MKRVLCLVTTVMLLFAMCASVYAVEPRAVTTKPSLSFDGTTANCKVIIINAGADIKATLELWNGSSLIGSWYDEGTSTLTIKGSCRVTKGVTYTLKVKGTVNGVSFSSTPLSRTC